MENNFIEMEWSRLWWLLSVVVTEYVLVLAAVGADMASGISKSRKRGEATRSRSLRRTVDKLARYYNVLVVLTVVDAMQIAGAWFMRAVEGYAVPTVPLFTLLGSLVSSAGARRRPRHPQRPQRRTDAHPPVASPHRTAVGTGRPLDTRSPVTAADGAFSAVKTAENGGLHAVF